MKTYKLIAAALLAGLSIIFQVFNNVLGVQTGFGMTVDLVGVPILIAFFVLGYDSALLVSVLLAVIITLISPTSYIGAFTKFAATLPMFLVPAMYLVALKRKFDSAKLAAGIAIVLLLVVSAFALSAYSTVFAGSITQNDLLVGLLPIFVITAAAYFFREVWKHSSGKTNMANLKKVHIAVLVLGTAIVVRGVSMIIANFYFAGPIFFKMSPAEFIAFMQGVQLPLLGSAPWHFIIFFWNAVQGIIEFALAWIIAFKFGFTKRYGLE